MMNIVPSTVEAVKSAPREVVEFVKDIPEHFRDAPEEISEFVKDDVPGFFRRVWLLIKTVVAKGTWQERVGLYLVAFVSVASLRTIDVLHEPLSIPYAILVLPLASMFLFTGTLAVLALMRAFHWTATPEKRERVKSNKPNPLKQAWRDVRGER